MQIWYPGDSCSHSTYDFQFVADAVGYSGKNPLAWGLSP